MRGKGGRRAATPPAEPLPVRAARQITHPLEVTQITALLQHSWTGCPSNVRAVVDLLFRGCHVLGFHVLGQLWVKELVTEILQPGEQRAASTNTVAGGAAPPDMAEAADMAEADIAEADDNITTASVMFGNRAPNPSGR